jgi:DNA-binding GntR family transcriptional regulator
MLQEQSLSEQVYRDIQRRLLDGSLRAGQILSEQAIADELGFSRTPVREAIGRLEAEGLVERVSRMGTIVRVPDYRDLRELYELREALEVMAARFASSHLLSVDLDVLSRTSDEIALIAVEMHNNGIDYLTGPALRRYLDADITFHMEIVRSVNNRRCMKIISEFRVIQRIFEYHRVVHTVRLVEQARDQHAGILAAIRVQNVDAAASAMQDHIRCSHANALAGFEGTETDAHFDTARLVLPDDLMARVAAL